MSTLAKSTHLTVKMNESSEDDLVSLNLFTELDTILTLLPEYRGYPSVTTLVNGLRKQVYSMPKDTLTHATLSEKNW